MLCDVQEPTAYRRIYREHLLVGHGVKSVKTSKEDSCWRDEALNLASQDVRDASIKSILPSETYGRLDMLDSLTVTRLCSVHAHVHETSMQVSPQYNVSSYCKCYATTCC